MQAIGQVWQGDKDGTKEMLIQSVKKTGRAVIVHEANLTGGIGGEIAAVI